MPDAPSARVLQLLSLLQARREWRGPELEDRLGVSPRTVRRDVERLRDLGYPIEATRGSAGGYRLVAGTAMPPLLLDDDEAVALALGARVAAAQAIAGVEDASLRALAKLEQVLPKRLARRVRELGRATAVAPAGDPAAFADPAVLAAAGAAIAGDRRVRFTYTNAEGATACRRVEPERLVAVGRRWYLVAHDADRDDWRLFRLDRVADLEAYGLPIAQRRRLPDPDAARFVTDRLHGLAPTTTAVVRFAAPAAEVRRRTGGALGEPAPAGARACVLRTPADTLDWLALRLLVTGLDFTVQEPPALREHLQAIARRATRSSATSA